PLRALGFNSVYGYHRRHLFVGRTMLIFADDISGGIALLGILVIAALALVVAGRGVSIFFLQRGGGKSLRGGGRRIGGSSAWRGVAIGIAKVLLGGAMLVMF